jgi:branched-chain amino acid transport system substrate-binding protein
MTPTKLGDSMKSSAAKIALWALVLAAMATTAPAADGPVYKIVSQSPLSGPQSAIGEAIKLGAQLAIEDFAGSAAVKLSLQPEDDQATPNVGVANANRIINDAQVLGVVAHYNSGVTIPASEVYAKVSLAAVSPAATNPVITDRESTRAVMNRVCGRDDIQGPAGADFAFDELNSRKVYVINDKTAYGAGLAQAFEAEMKKKGGTVILSAGVDDKETDFSPILNRAMLDRPDLIFYGGYYPQAALLIKQLKQKHLKAKLIGGDGLDSADLQKVAGADNMQDVYFTTTSVPIGKLPAAAQFAAAYKSKFGKDPEGYAAYGYDAAHALVLAISQAATEAKGAPSRPAVAAALRKISFDGLTGHIEFNAHGDIKSAKYVAIAAGRDATMNEVVKVIDVAAPSN